MTVCAHGCYVLSTTEPAHSRACGWVRSRSLLAIFAYGWGPLPTDKPAPQHSKGHTRRTQSRHYQLVVIENKWAGKYLWGGKIGYRRCVIGSLGWYFFVPTYLHSLFVRCNAGGSNFPHLCFLGRRGQSFLSCALQREPCPLVAGCVVGFLGWRFFTLAHALRSWDTTHMRVKFSVSVSFEKKRSNFLFSCLLGYPTKSSLSTYPTKKESFKTPNSVVGRLIDFAKDQHQWRHDTAQGRGRSKYVFLGQI